MAPRATARIIRSTDKWPVTKGRTSRAMRPRRGSVVSGGLAAMALSRDKKLFAAIQAGKHLGHVPITTAGGDHGPPPNPVLLRVTISN